MVTFCSQTSGSPIDQRCSEIRFPSASSFQDFSSLLVGVHLFEVKKALHSFSESLFTSRPGVSIVVRTIIAIVLKLEDLRRQLFPHSREATQLAGFVVNRSGKGKKLEIIFTKNLKVFCCLLSTNR